MFEFWCQNFMLLLMILLQKNSNIKELPNMLLQIEKKIPHNDSECVYTIYIVNCNSILTHGHSLTIIFIFIHCK